MDANADELGRIDAIAGDGDHGIGMERGVRAAVEAAADAVARGAGAATTLHFAADAWADKAGGTSGALWGMALRAVGDAVGDSNAPDAGAVAAGVAGAAAAIMDFGKAKPGDKTLVDVLVPFRDALAAGVDAGQSLTDAWGAAATVAAAGRRGHRPAAAPHGPRPPARREEPRHPGRRRRVHGPDRPRHPQHLRRGESCSNHH